MPSRSTVSNHKTLLGKSRRYKFDLRLYVAVSSFEPLRAYVFEEGLCRFSTARYSDPADGGSAADADVFAHLTNYSINKRSSHFVPNADAADDGFGSKWS